MRILFVWSILIAFITITVSASNTNYNFLNKTEIALDGKSEGHQPLEEKEGLEKMEDLFSVSNFPERILAYQSLALAYMQQLFITSGYYKTILIPPPQLV